MYSLSLNTTLPFHSTNTHSLICISLLISNNTTVTPHYHSTYTPLRIHSTLLGSSPVKAGAAAVGAALTGMMAGAKKGAVAEPEKPPVGMKVKEVVTPAKKMKGE